MKVELLYSESCPNYEAARERVERILARRRLAVPVELVCIEHTDTGARTRFFGSPTLLVNRRDVEVARREDPPALGCRLYESVQEGRSPLPPVSWIEAAIADALVEEGAEVNHCAAAPRATVQGNCPECSAKGKATWHVTIESLLTADAVARLGSEEHLYCPSETCDVVYFAPETGSVFRKGDLLVRIGAKETEAPRPVCHCFGHSVETIEEEIRRTGRSIAVERITESMKGGCRCEIVRPQSTCCLGDVTRAAIEGTKKAGARPAPARAPEQEGCGQSCPAPAARAPAADALKRSRGSAQTGVLAAIASVVTATVASACCWLPLLLVAVGASAAGVSAAFDRVRPYFLAGATVFLAAGYYFVFFRRKGCAADPACAAPNRRVGRFNKGMLLLATALVLAIALFPNYIGVLIGADRPASAASGAPPSGALETVTLTIEGMTCEACTTHVRSALLAVPGVRSAEVRYAGGVALVRHERGAPPPRGALIRAVEDTGYRASVALDGR